MIKKLNKNSVITAVCTFLIVITTFASFTAFATTSSGSAVLKAYTLTTTINDVTKSFDDKYCTIYVKKSLSNVSNFSAKFWVKDITKGKDLTDRKTINCTSTKKGYWIPYKSGATSNRGDTLRFYGSQADSSSKGIDYVIYSDKATL